MAGAPGQSMDVRIGGEASALVGGTPLVSLGRLGEDIGGEVVAKLEYLNPGGSCREVGRNPQPRLRTAKPDAKPGYDLIEDQHSTGLAA
jgi:cystathionine beta-synthase